MTEKNILAKDSENFREQKFDVLYSSITSIHQMILDCQIKREIEMRNLIDLQKTEMD